MVLLSGISLFKSVTFRTWFALMVIVMVIETVIQPMMGTMQALSTVVKKVSAHNFVGSAVLNLLQSQVSNVAHSFIDNLLMSCLLLLDLFLISDTSVSRQKPWPVIML